MEEQWVWALGILVTAYALSAFWETSWALWLAVASTLPVVLMLSTDATPGL